MFQIPTVPPLPGAAEDGASIAPAEILAPNSKSTTVSLHHWSDITHLLNVVHSKMDEKDEEEPWTSFVTSSNDVINKTGLVYSSESNSNRTTVVPPSGGDQEGGGQRLPPDIYLILVVATVSLIVLALVLYACLKAVRMLKVTLNDGREDSVPVPHATSASAAEQGVTSSATTSGGVTSSATAATAANTQSGSSGTLTRLANGIRNLHSVPHIFSATLRSTTSTKSDDNPPPYEEDLPPSYTEALKMSNNSESSSASCKIHIDSSAASVSGSGGGAGTSNSAISAATSSSETQSDETDHSAAAAAATPKRPQRTHKKYFNPV